MHSSRVRSLGDPGEHLGGTRERCVGKSEQLNDIEDLRTDEATEQKHALATTLCFEFSL